MELKTIISKQPICKTCNKPLLTWNPFEKEHEHYKCASDRIVASLMDLVRNDLGKHK
jgi:hypothetical protein